MYLLKLLQLSTLFQGYAIAVILTRLIIHVFPEHDTLIGCVVIILTAILFGLYHHLNPNIKWNYALFVSMMIGALVGSVS